MVEILEANFSSTSTEAHGDISLNPEKGGIYLVNRLDRLTSGIVLVARNVERTQSMAVQFTERLVSKSYLCRCVGEFPEEVCGLFFDYLGYNVQGTDIELFVYAECELRERGWETMRDEV
jgi:23S rRNA-/tRNA-specific pseudouridylate synthase